MYRILILQDVADLVRHKQEFVPLEWQVWNHRPLVLQMVLVKAVLVFYLGFPLQKILALIFTTCLVRKLQLLKEEVHTEWG